MVHLEDNNDKDINILPSVKWAIENDLFLDDFVQKFNLPHLAIVTKGQYLDIGAPNYANPSLTPFVLVDCSTQSCKVIGQMVSGRDIGRKNGFVGHKIAINACYDGLFEILSEDGKPPKCLETVKELWEQFPELALVRSACKAYVPDSINGELISLNKKRTIAEGQILTPCGQFTLKRISFLRCFDSVGNSVYLKMSQKTKFSAVAKKGSLTGCHSLQNLIDGCKRLPLVIRLVKGTFPDNLRISAGEPVIRIQQIIHQNVVLLQSFSNNKIGSCYLVPSNAYLKLACAKNQPTLDRKKEFIKMCNDTKDKLHSLSNVIELYHESMSNTKVDNNNTTIDSTSTGQSNDAIMLSKDSLQRITQQNPTRAPLAKHEESPPVSDDEIEQLYDYVRGLAPLPESCYKDFKPKPPPLTSLPRKNKPHSNSQRSERRHQEVRQNRFPRAPVPINHSQYDSSTLSRYRQSDSNTSHQVCEIARVQSTRQRDAKKVNEKPMCERSKSQSSGDRRSRIQIKHTPQKPFMTDIEVGSGDSEVDDEANELPIPDILVDHQVDHRRLKSVRNPTENRRAGDDFRKMSVDALMSPMNPAKNNVESEKQFSRRARPYSMVMTDNAMPHVHDMYYPSRAFVGRGPMVIYHNSAANVSIPSVPVMFANNHPYYLGATPPHQPGGVRLMKPHIFH